MKRNKIRVAVMRIEGTNCEYETYIAFKRFGVNAEIVHLKQFAGSDIFRCEKRKLDDYHCLIFPGGFSGGDYIRAGVMFAQRAKSIFGYSLLDYVSDGFLIGGICNGFQILVEMGLLPAFRYPISEVQEAALTTNDSFRFECRPTFLRHENGGNCIFTRELKKGDVIMTPSAHAEGKLVFPHNKEKEYYEKLIENDMLVFKYVNPNGEEDIYPWNPNGSIYNIAGICNKTGNVFGMMPHPERIFYNYQHPEATRLGRKKMKEYGSGMLIFKSIIEYIEKKF